VYILAFDPEYIPAFDPAFDPENDPENDPPKLPALFLRRLSLLFFSLRDEGGLFLSPLSPPLFLLRI